MGKGRTPKWLYLVAALALIWNALGCMAFVQQAMLSDAQIDALPAAGAALYRGMPMWATIAFAAAVFGGATGSLALLFRQRFALILFTASLLGVLLQMFHLFILARGVEVLGAGALTMPGMIIVVAFALVWLARTAARRGWLD